MIGEGVEREAKAEAGSPLGGHCSVHLMVAWTGCGSGGGESWLDNGYILKVKVKRQRPRTFLQGF